MQLLEETSSTFSCSKINQYDIHLLWKNPFSQFPCVFSVVRRNLKCFNKTKHVSSLIWWFHIIIRFPREKLPMKISKHWQRRFFICFSSLSLIWELTFFVKFLSSHYPLSHVKSLLSSVAVEGNGGAPISLTAAVKLKERVYIYIYNC
jgi:hypothetical protein